MTEEKFNKNYDIFRSFLIADANYDGYIELHCIKQAANCLIVSSHFLKLWQRQTKTIIAGLYFMNMTEILNDYGIIQNSI